MCARDRERVGIRPLLDPRPHIGAGVNGAAATRAGRGLGKLVYTPLGV